MVGDGYFGDAYFGDLGEEGADYEKTGSLTAGSSVSGAEVAEHAEDGALAAGTTTSGADERTAAETGTLAAGTTLAGTDSETSEHSKEGALVAGSTLSGETEAVAEREGALVAGSTLAGADAAVHEEEGSVAAGTTLAGTDVVVTSITYEKEGALVAGTKLAASDAEAVASIYWCARIAGDFQQAHYGAPNADWAPWSASTPGGSWDLFEEHAGKRVSAVQWGNLPNAWPPLYYDTNAADLVRSRGAFSMYDWTPPTVGFNDILADNATAHAYIAQRLAIPMKNHGDPLLLRFGHEMNGNWGWSNQTAQGLTPAEYVQAWRTVWQIFADVMGGFEPGSGLGTDTGNVSFGWCPNIFISGQGIVTDPTDHFPGVEYVDWMMFDGYLQGSIYVSPGDLFDETFDTLQTLSGGTLPIGIGETGCEAPVSSPGKAAWTTALWCDWLTEHPEVKFINQFNQSDNPVHPFIEVGDAATTLDGAALTAFQTCIGSTHFLDNIVNSETFPSGEKVPVPEGGVVGGGGEPVDPGDPPPILTDGGGDPYVEPPLVAFSTGVRLATPTPPWRFFLTTNETLGLAFLDRIAKDRQITPILNQPYVASGVVQSDDPEVNLPYPAAADDPYLSVNSRLLYAFRREGGDPPWRCRYAGMIMQTEDQGNDVPTTRFTAYDPWMYLFQRPVLTGGGALPGEDGLSYTNTEGSTIATDLLANTVFANGEVGIVLGTIQPTPLLGTGGTEFRIARGASVGEAWKQLVDTGTMDIVLTPIYDPDQPGVMSVLNIYTRVGTRRDNSPFAWDMPTRSITSISRLIDGTEMANVIQYYAGQGGVPVTQQRDEDSILKYGERWAQGHFPGREGASAEVELLALSQLLLRRAGHSTLQFDATPVRAPRALTNFLPGDTVPIYASRRLRDPLTRSVV